MEQEQLGVESLTKTEINAIIKLMQYKKAFFLVPYNGNQYQVAVSQKTRQRLLDKGLAAPIPDRPGMLTLDRCGPSNPGATIVNQERIEAALAGVVLLGIIACLAVPDPPYAARHALEASQKLQDVRIASSDPATVCATDGLPGSAYSRQHRIVARQPVPGHQIDHIVPLALGGADTDANIQIQPLDEALLKDQLERFAARAVCRDHTISLREAQQWFLTNWKVQLWRLGR